MTFRHKVKVIFEYFSVNYNNVQAKSTLCRNWVDIYFEKMCTWQNKCWVPSRRLHDTVVS